MEKHNNRLLIFLLTFLRYEVIDYTIRMLKSESVHVSYINKLSISITILIIGKKEKNTHHCNFMMI